MNKIMFSLLLQYVISKFIWLNTCNKLNKQININKNIKHSEYNVIYKNFTNRKTSKHSLKNKILNINVTVEKTDLCGLYENFIHFTALV